jgi:hypothetical protein
MTRYKRYFKKTIKNHFPDRFTNLMMEINREYQDIAVDTRFAATSRNPLDKRLDFCAYFLALIKTLDKAGESFETIRVICLEIVIDYVRPKNKVHAFWKRFLPKLVNTPMARIGLRFLNKRVSQNTNPQGFVAHIITDKQKTYGLGYGFDILECGICKLFKKHNYEKYASILCEVDKVTSGLAGLELIRTGTIANGAKTCDFRFKKLK